MSSWEEEKKFRSTEKYIPSCCMGGGVHSTGLTAQVPVESSQRAKECRFSPAST